MIAVAQLVGATLFSIGSACFVWMAYVDEWLLPLRLGCAFWLGGCVPYLWPPLREELRGTDAHASNVLQVCGMLAWAVGSAFAFLDDLDTALEVTDGGFLAGSVCLLCDPLLQAHAQHRSGTPADRDERASLLADVLAGLFYVLAGAFGGYAEDLGLVRFGNCCWLVGSLISGTRPCLALFARARRGRAASAKSAVLRVELEAKAATLPAPAETV